MSSAEIFGVECVTGYIRTSSGDSVNDSNRIEKVLFVGDTVPNRYFDIGRSLRNLCREHDLRVFNLEGAFSNLRKPLFKAGPHLLLEAEFLAPLAECFNVAALSNNHVMDFGAEGLETTMLTCRGAGLATVGAGANIAQAFLPLDEGGCRIISVAEHEFGAARSDKAGIAVVDRPLELHSAIREGRDEDKFVIVVAHGGTERIPIPPPYLRERYKLWVEFGADLVIGNHPHVVQGYETYLGRPIFYCLGNFLFVTDSDGHRPQGSWSIAVSVDIPGRKVSVLPVSVSRDGLVDLDHDQEHAKEFERLCGMIQSDDYEALYLRIAAELYEKYYPRLGTAGPEDAALLLHYLRCDAHRNLVQAALSQRIHEQTQPAPPDTQVDEDSGRRKDQGNAVPATQIDLGDKSENWFSHEECWSKLLTPLKGRDNLLFLELGSWKGRSALWLAENILTGRNSKVVCVDVWDVGQWNSEATETKALLANPQRARQLRVDRLYETFLNNTAHLRRKIVPVRKKTSEALREFVDAGDKFDFVYVDADHSEQAVYEDFRLSLRCLKPGGIVFLDDLSWDSVRRAVHRIRKELNLEIVEVGANGAYYVSPAGPKSNSMTHTAARRVAPAPRICRAEEPPAPSCAPVVKAMDGRNLSLPQLPDAGSLSSAPRPTVEGIISDVGNWADPRLVYLASADQWLGFEAFFRKNDLMQCDVFYSVIGGLGGLNLLARLKPLKKIVFYDANIYAARILDLQLQLIRHCSSVEQYISLIYQRPFDRSKYTFDNQADYLRLPLEERYAESLERVLTADAHSTYRHFYLPYIVRGHEPLHDGPTCCCTSLLPFFESASVTDPLVSGLGADCVNINTFYVGKGWLGSDETFRVVRSHLLESETEVRIGDIAEIRPEGDFPGIYTTNIYDTRRRTGYTKFSHLFGWMIGYDDSANWEVCYYPTASAEGMVRYAKLIGAGNRNPHATCCEAIDGLLDLNANKFLEVIEPPPSEGMKYGFRFYAGQKPIKVQDYLSGDFTGEKIIAVHILLGGGTPQEHWRKVCRKAVAEAEDHVLIFEHRKECGDWPQRGVYHDNLPTHSRLDQFIYSLDYRWKKYGIANVRGDIGDVRNILYYLDKSQEGGVSNGGNTERDTIRELGSNACSARDYGEILADIQANDLTQAPPVPNAASAGPMDLSIGEGIVMAREYLKSGVEQLRSGNSYKALGYFDKAIALCPETPEVHFAKAAACLQQGDVLSAGQACEAELNRNPDHRGARKLLERIETEVGDDRIVETGGSQIDRHVANAIDPGAVVEARRQR